MHSSSMAGSKTRIPVVSLRVALLGMALVGGAALADAPKQRLNPLISLIEQGKPAMGLYAPSNRRHGPPERQ